MSFGLRRVNELLTERNVDEREILLINESDF